MTQEEKFILLQDLCARLPYGVICTDSRHGDSRITEINIVDEIVYCDDFDEYVELDNIKPYLRPMSSMTEEEDKEYAEVIVKSQDCSLENSESATTMANDWLLSKGFDVRGLISKGLALKALDNMYK